MKIEGHRKFFVEEPQHRLFRCHEKVTTETSKVNAQTSENDRRFGKDAMARQPRATEKRAMRMPMTDEMSLVTDMLRSGIEGRCTPRNQKVTKLHRIAATLRSKARTSIAERPSSSTTLRTVGRS